MHNKHSAVAKRGLSVWGLLSLLLVAELGCGGAAEDKVSASEAASQAAAAEMKVTAVALGKGVGPDVNVTAPTTTFGTLDTIDIAISTTGAMTNATLMLMFRRAGDTITLHHENKTISPTGAATTAFRLARPDVFVPGKYSLDTFLNGGLADMKDFEVRK